MLRHTFLHVPGVGYITERRLWAEGLLSWEDCLGHAEARPLSGYIRGTLVPHLEASVKALHGGDARYFGEKLPPGEMWRVYPEFRDSVAFVDIETTGLFHGTDVITVIGLFDGKSTKVFVRGINLEEFPLEIKKYSLLVTFNGKRFDLPFLRRAFGELPDYIADIDLLYVLKRLGYRGGLKSIERQLGLEREGALQGVDGFLAVLLWREYERGNQAALHTLVRYNLEDVVNLQYLADIAYNQSVVTLPIPVEPLPVRTKYTVSTPFDPYLIRYLKRFTG